MKSLNFTRASRGRKTVVLSGTSMTGAEAPALEEPSLPDALHSQNSCGKCARCRGSSGLRGATRHRIRAHVCRHTRRRDRRITLSPNKVVLDSSRARTLGWRAESAGAACGAGAVDAGGEGSTATQWAGTRRATSRWAQRGAARRRGQCIESAGSRGDPTSVSAAQAAGRASSFIVRPRRRELRILRTRDRDGR
jgi:hypothetical protein